jgi:predicted RNA-binding protein associated with RNAse of E/G family
VNPGDTIVTRRGDAHSLWLLWTEAWDLRCWYVQLQEPIVERDAAIETTDHALDVLVHPDGTWQWKDEDDWAEAITLGAFDEAKAAAIRAEGERVIAAKPWPTGWETWRPDPSWELPVRPPGWDAC